MRTLPIVLVALVLAGCAPAAPLEKGDDGRFIVTPVVVSSAVSDDGLWLSASGYVEGIAEDDGRCTFTFRAAGGGASRLSSVGKADGSRTDCGTVEERTRTLFADDYELTITYESPTAAGESEPFPFVVPPYPTD